MRIFLVFAASFGVSIVAPNDALAQYKNSAFGFDVGAWFFTQPPVVDENNEPLPPNQRPLRFSNGVRVGGESNFKMSSDHWWFTLRVSVGALQFSSDGSGDVEDQFDSLAEDSIGTVLGLEGLMGVRYVLATDRVRPYIQLATSYMRLFSFGANTECLDNLFCNGGGINSQAAFLPTNDIGAIHFQPGLELIVERDIALHFYLDIQRWIRFRAEDNWAPVLGVGVNFFT